MYTRQLSRKKRYSPPPGYMGTAFQGPPQDIPMEGKVHSPEAQTAGAASRSPVRESREETGKPAASSVLGDLLGDLRGRIGAEELILVLVMLLLASDGAGSEILLLALILLGGGEEGR